MFIISLFFLNSAPETVPCTIQLQMSFHWIQPILNALRFVAIPVSELVSKLDTIFQI